MGFVPGCIVYEFSETNGFLILKFENSWGVQYVSYQDNRRSGGSPPEIRVISEKDALTLIASNNMYRTDGCGD